ncbi:hypothetical protein MKW92_044326 [Papaver armeniacum]|nr:hypothetical protein MKW92_044326 [Papaver armeniacum]
MYSDESDVDFNYEDELITEDTKKAPQKICAVMHADVIRQKQEEDISSTSNVLAVSRVSAIILLLRYNWFAEKLKEEWFADEEKMHDVAGCAHLFCESCWKGYIGTSVNDGPGCLKLPCPEPSCNAANAAKNHLAKYSHYYERWVANHSSMDHAVKSMNGQVEELCFILCPDEKEVKFIKDAWEKIIECRRILEWSYAFGLYLPEHEHAKIELFEYLQGEAESRLERLHRFVEKELQVCQDSKTPSENFNKNRNKLEIQTTTTGDHFEKLVNAFKDGQSEVHSQGAGCSNRERAAYEYEGRKYAGSRSLNYESSEYGEFSRVNYDSTPVPKLKIRAHL